jgi:hypothetical protein
MEQVCEPAASPASHHLPSSFYGMDFYISTRPLRGPESPLFP